jgi:hypothetical protein
MGAARERRVARYSPKCRLVVAPKSEECCRGTSIS